VSGGGVKIIGGYAASLLIGKVDHCQAWMKAIMAGAKKLIRLHFQWRVRGEASGVFVEPELENSVRSKGVSGRLHHTIVQAGDVGYEGELVGRVGLDTVSGGRGFQPLGGPVAQSSIILDRMYRHVGALIIGG